MRIVSDVKTDVNMREVTFEISAEALEAACERVYQRQKKDIVIKGFRKGKAPRKMVEKLYGEGVFFEDAVDSLLPAELDEMMKELQLTLVDRPAIELVSCSKEEGAVCKAVCITKPEVELGEYKGIHAPKQVREVTDEDVDQQINVLRQRQARIVEVEGRPAELQDEVKINFEGFIDDVAFEGGKGEEYPLRLGSGQFIPGFEEQIVGHNVGDQFDINVTFPEEYGDERYAGKAAVFKIELLGISKQELPEADDELAKDVSEFDTMEALREDIRAKLTETAQKQAENQFENAVFDALIASADAAIPSVMYERRISQMVRDFEQNLQRQYSDMKLSDYLELTGMTEQQLRDTYEEQARKEVLLRLALEKVADLEGLTVSDEELEEGLQDFAARVNVPLEVVKAQIPMADFAMDMRVTKAVELVKSNAVVDNDMAQAEETETAAEAAEEETPAAE
ncbi:MAG: trigger factor [Oscillospiraceae bacterium]|nr:trigger factor [Oscillospiraceae bacterium]